MLSSVLKLFGSMWFLYSYDTKNFIYINKINDKCQLFVSKKSFGDINYKKFRGTVQMARAKVSENDLLEDAFRRMNVNLPSGDELVMRNNKPLVSSIMEWKEETSYASGPYPESMRATDTRRGKALSI